MANLQHARIINHPRPRRAFMLAILVWAGSLTHAQDLAPQEPQSASWSRVEVSRQVALLRQQLELAAVPLQDCEARIPALQREIDELTQQLDQLAITARPADAAARPDAVRYRLPLAQHSDRPVSRSFVCEGGRAFPIDFDAINAAISPEAADKFARDNRTAETGVWPVARGAFDVAYLIRRQGDQLAFGPLWLQKKPGAVGDDLEAFGQSGTSAAQALGATDPHMMLLTFAVRSDSFDGYHQLRMQLLSQGYDLFWLPYSTEDRVIIGGGAGRGVGGL